MNIICCFKIYGYTFSQSLRIAKFNETNAGRHIFTGFLQTFLNIGNDWLLPWPASSSDLSPLEKRLVNGSERLAHHHMLVLTVEKLQNLFEAA